MAAVKRRSTSGSARSRTPAASTSASRAAQAAHACRCEAPAGVGSPAACSSTAKSERCSPMTCDLFLPGREGLGDLPDLLQLANHRPPGHAHDGGDLLLLEAIEVVERRDLQRAVVEPGR